MQINTMRAQLPVYKDPKQPAENRTKDLLKRMTIEEKAGQLNQLNGGFFLNVIGSKETKSIQEIAVKESRLGIPILFALEVIHG